MNEVERVMAWARSQDYAAGQNVRDTPMGGLELLLVPDCETVHRVAWLGAPTRGDRAMVSAALPRAELTVVANLGALGRERYDVVVVTDAAATRALAADDSTASRRAATALRQAVDGDGTAFVHVAARRQERVASALQSARPGAGTATLRGFPLRGPLRALLPVGDAAGYRLLERRGLLRPSAGEGELRQLVDGGRGPRPAGDGRGWSARAIRFARQGVRAATQLLASAERRAGAGVRFGRSVVVLGPGAGRVPAYLERLTESVGLSAWTLAAPGAYPSQKVLWALRRPGPEDVSVLAKMTRDPRFSARLANAYEVLSIVAGYPDPVGSSVPRPVFSGRVGGLAIAGEESVAGGPLGSLATLGAGAPQVREAVEWLITLAERSRHEASGVAVAEALEELQARLEGAAPMSNVVASALRASTTVLRELGSPLPLVLQHGDPGVNNILMRDDGGIVVLDWENGEQHGMPLWDLLYFVRSVAVASEAGHGTGRLEASLLPFTEDGPLADLLWTATQDLARRIQIPGAAIEPLVLHCWVQQALKETTRLPAGAADRSIFLRFLHELAARRDRPVFRRLCAIGAP